MEYPIGSMSVPFVSVSYVVEERLLEKPGVVSFAWSCKTRGEATKRLLDEMWNNGHKRTYRLFLSVDVRNSSERV